MMNDAMARTGPSSLAAGLIAVAFDTLPLGEASSAPRQLSFPEASLALYSGVVVIGAAMLASLLKSVNIDIAAHFTAKMIESRHQRLNATAHLGR